MMTLNRYLIVFLTLLSTSLGLATLIVPLVHAMDSAPLSASFRQSLMGSSIYRLPEELLLQVCDYSEVRDTLYLAKTRKDYRTSIINYLGTRKEFFKVRKKTISDVKFIALFSEVGIFSKIKKLDLSYSKFNLNMLAYLPETLKELKLTTAEDLRGHPFGDAGARAIARSPNLSHLSRLSLNDNQIRDAGAQAIAHSPYLSHLTRLDLNGNEIKNEGAIAIAESSYMSHLSRLELGGNEIENDGVIAIAGSSYMSHLSRLDLGSNEIENDGAIAITRSSYMSHLSRLEFYDNHIGDAGAQAIAHSPHLSTLTQLDLSDNEIENDGAIAIAGSSFMSRLTRLELFGNPIGVAGTEAIAHSPFLRILRDASKGTPHP